MKKTDLAQHYYDKDEAKIKALYADILYMEHHQSLCHKHMNNVDRAAQFGAFAALTGHYDALVEKARYTEKLKDMETDAKDMLDHKIKQLLTSIQFKNDVKIVYFKPDEKKEGGRYLTVVSAVKKLDEMQSVLFLETGEEIAFSNIINIEFLG